MTSQQEWQPTPQDTKGAPDYVIDQIQQALISGTLTPGERLPSESELAASFHVSRGSIRQAMKALEMLGIVTIRPGNGTYINKKPTSKSFNPLSYALLLANPNMKMIVEGVMDGNLPWTLVFIGIFTAVVVEILGIPVLPVAIGLYLPLELSTTIMLGGIIRWFADSKSKNKNDEAGSGVLFCSGMIAGEGLVGIILAVLAVIGIDSKIDLSESVNLGTIGGIILLAVMIGCVAYFAMQKKALNTNEKEKSEE